MTLGASSGPRGILIGGLLGSFFGGALTALFSRYNLETSSLELKIDFSEKNKSSSDSYGVNP
jgi:hypothetical protein